MPGFESNSVLRDVVGLLDGWYPPATADSWDAVGLVAGDPDAPVRKVLLAVDPVQSVADEAATWGADLLVVHHPLFLKAVHGVAATTAKGRTLATLTKAGCALHTAHTNADQARDGVSEALATALGLTDQQPIRPAPTAALDKLVVYVPVGDAERVRTAMTDAGGGRIGDYDSASFTTAGEGRFRPLDGAAPVDRRGGQARGRRRAARRVRRVAGAPWAGGARDARRASLRGARVGPRGARRRRSRADRHRTGRLGRRDDTRDFAALVGAVLPATPSGVRFGRRPRPRRTTGGGVWRSRRLPPRRARDGDADVYVTSDLRHHLASEFLEKGGPALVDVPHWAAEWTWLPVVGARLAEALGDTVEARVSRIVTDPWHARIQSHL